MSEFTNDGWQIGIHRFHDECPAHSVDVAAKVVNALGEGWVIQEMVDEGVFIATIPESACIDIELFGDFVDMVGVDDIGPVGDQWRDWVVEVEMP